MLTLSFLLFSFFLEVEKMEILIGCRLLNIGISYTEAKTP